MPGVIDAKLHRPAPSGLSRRRLVDPLVQEAGPGVAMVIAPPGSGKTTLLARAAASASRPAGWCSIGPEDRSGPGFLAHVAQSLARAAGGDPFLPRDVPELLASPAVGPSSPVALYLDDVHELAGGTAEGYLADLLRWRPANLKVVLGTRRPLSVNTPRLVVSGELVELDGEALRFRSWEVEELFRVEYDEPLSPEGAAALTRRTGGWAAGLKLFHLATAGKPAPERERAVAELGGRSRLLRTYLTRTVLDELEPSDREFLLVTSTLGTLTGPLCDALLERRGSAAVLDQLAARQFFVVPSEDGTCFRYHQVMQTLLAGLLVDELGAEAARQVYDRSAGLLESAGRPADAARAYALAEDFASVARLVQQSNVGVTTDHRDQLTLPPDDPWLALAHARRLLRLGAVDHAVAAFRGAEGLLDDSDFRRRCQEERAAAALWSPVSGPEALDRVRRAGPRTAAELVRRATCRCGDLPMSTTPVLPLALGHLLSGELGRTRAVLSQADGLTATERLLADLVLVLVDLVEGEGESTLGRLEEVSLHAELDDQPWVARLARGVQAAVLMATSPDSWRPDSCAALVEESVRTGDEWGAMLLTGLLGAALVRRRDPEAGGWLDRAADGAARLGAPVLQAWACAVGAAWARHQESPDAAARAGLAEGLARACNLPTTDAVVGALLREPASSLAPPAAPTRICCLGGFSLEVGGQAVDLSGLRPLPRSLLMLLALHHGREVHREVLIDRLWPDVSVEAATHRLHATASSARRFLVDAGLPEGALGRHGSAYRLDVEQAKLDLEDLEAALHEAARAVTHDEYPLALETTLRCLDLYRGDLLPEAGPAEWVVSERDRLRALAANAAYTGARLALEAGQLELALDTARRATELDPLRDTAWSLLAEVQARMGDVTAAAVTRNLHAHDQGLGMVGEGSRAQP